MLPGNQGSHSLNLRSITKVTFMCSQNILNCPEWLTHFMLSKRQADVKFTEHPSESDMKLRDIWVIRR